MQNSRRSNNSTEHGKYYENIDKLDDWDKQCSKLNFRLKKVQ